MADEKKKKIKSKVKSTVKTSPSIDTALDQMASLFIAKPETGEMELLIKKVNGEIAVNEYNITETLNDSYKELGAQIRELATADLANEQSGKIKVTFEIEYKVVTA